MAKLNWGATEKLRKKIIYPLQQKNLGEGGLQMTPKITNFGSAGFLAVLDKETNY
jgi:hypothetical protein